MTALNILLKELEKKKQDLNTTLLRYDEELNHDSVVINASNFDKKYPVIDFRMPKLVRMEILNMYRLTTDKGKHLYFPFNDKTVGIGLKQENKICEKSVPYEKIALKYLFLLGEWVHTVSEHHFLEAKIKNRVEIKKIIYLLAQLVPHRDFNCVSLEDALNLFQKEYAISLCQERPKIKTVGKGAWQLITKKYLHLNLQVKPKTDNFNCSAETKFVSCSCSAYCHYLDSVKLWLTNVINSHHNNVKTTQ